MCEAMTSTLRSPRREIDVVDVRAQQLRARSPELCRDRPEEARARLAEPMPANVHVVIENHGAHETQARQKLIDLMVGTLRAFNDGYVAEGRSD